MAVDDTAAVRKPEPPAEETAAPASGEARTGSATPVPVAPSGVRIDYAPVTAAKDVVLVPPEPPEEEVSGERPAHDADETAFPEAEVTAPRRAADVLPPRNRRPAPREDHDTPPHGLRLRKGGGEDPAQGKAGEDPNERPSRGPRPILARPLFEQDWGATPQGTPSWRPGAPPTDVEPSKESWYVVGTFALLGVGAIILWLWWWT